MRNFAKWLLASMILFLYGNVFAAVGDSSVVWMIDNVDSIGGNVTVKTGDPIVIQTSIGPAVLFDGVDDDLLVQANPIEGDTVFTLEAIFRPDSVSYPDNNEQRFLHIQRKTNPEKQGNRILFEMRVTDDNKWWADSFIKTNVGSYILAPKTKLYAFGEWHHHALVFDGDSMYHYINGVKDTSTAAKYSAIEDAYTSLGVRMDLMPARPAKSWFKGAIHMIKGTNRALDPSEFTRTDTTATAIRYKSIKASDYKLNQNYPNPFNPKTIINYELPVGNEVELSVYNLMGQKIATLVNKTQSAGAHQVEWNANGFASGVYYYILSGNDFTQTKKMILIK